MKSFLSSLRVLFLCAFCLPGPGSAAWAAEKEKVEFEGTVRAEIGGRHLEQGIEVRYSKQAWRIVNARWPHRTLVGMEKGLKNQNSMILRGSLLHAPVTLSTDATQTAELQLPPEDECAAVLVSAVGLYAIANIGGQSQLEAHKVQRKDQFIEIEPGVDRSARLTIRRQKEWLELQIAPAGKKFVPLPSPRRTR